MNGKRVKGQAKYSVEQTRLFRDQHENSLGSLLLHPGAPARVRRPG